MLYICHCFLLQRTDIGGIAGGEKFLVQNILFKICTDHCGVFNGNEYYAHKLGSHELKGLINIFNYGSSLGLYLPIRRHCHAFFIDYAHICAYDVCAKLQRLSHDRHVSFAHQ